jgi:hypothetical protein
MYRVRTRAHPANIQDCDGVALLIDERTGQIEIGTTPQQYQYIVLMSPLQNHG